VLTAAHLELPGDRPPWTATGVTVRRGDRVTLLGSGRIGWADGAGPRRHLWGRVAGGAVFGCPRASTTVVADRSGPLHLCVHPGASTDHRGDRETLRVTVLVWPAGLDPVDGLAALDPDVADPVLVATERQRLLDPVVPPAGWSALPALGPSDVFRHAPGAPPTIDVVSEADAGVLERAVDVCPDGGRGPVLDWSWRVAQLPGPGPEDTRAGHDHLGVAVRFADGRHLSWIWSVALRPEDDAFNCPAPGWSGCQTHVPVRRGPIGLGHWRRESRRVRLDHERFVGGRPDRIAAVQLVALSHLGRGRARASFRDIVLRHGDQQVRLL
jgi:hypothetical protein